MPIDPRRREAIEAAIAAYNHANPLASLPRNAVRLLAAMFPASDICERSLEAIAARGFSRRTLPATLERLYKAGFLSHHRGEAYRLHLPPVRR